jgi:hypothetical protein
MKNSWVVGFLGIVLLLACAKPFEPKYTEQDILSAEQAGSLESLYEQVTADLAAPELSVEERTSLEETQRSTGQKLAAQLEADVRKSLDRSALASGLVSAPVIAAETARIAPMQTWDPSAYQDLSAELASRAEETRKAIQSKKSELSSLSEDQAVEKLAIYEALEDLSGKRTKAGRSYAAERDEYIRDLSQTAAQALENEEYSDAQRMLQIVKSVKPDDAAIEGQLIEADTRLFEQRFFKTLEDGKPDEGYELLCGISESSDFEKIRPRLGESGEVMADYFVALAATATEGRDLPDAYRWFVQARDIRDRLDLQKKSEVAEEKPFLKQIHERFVAARERETYGLAWGYLKVIAELDPGSAQLRRELRETREKVLDRAIKRLSGGAFADAHSGPKFGEAVGSKVLQYLFEKIPEDVRIIERAQLGDIERERQLADRSASRLASADYLIQGTILEAKVDTSEKKGRETMRVTTGLTTVENPAHVEWEVLPKKEREKTPEPRATVQVEKKEDVSIDITLHRKVGVFSVSYRIIDAVTAKVLFADSMQLQTEFQDTGSDGVQLGDFKREFKLASLPSDIEILAKLADDISDQVGAKLAEELSNPEVQYAEAAERFVREDNFVEASERCAFATVLTERKEQDASELVSKLRTYAVAVTPRAE